MLLRQLLRLLGVVLFHSGLAPLVIWLNRRTPKVLLYHACELVESDYIRGLDSNITPRDFAAHLDLLKHYYQVISLEQLESGPIPERAVVITFDDGYRSVYDAAYPLLHARGMTATVCLVTTVVDNRALVWVNALNWLLRRHPEICIPVARRLLGMASSLQSAREYVLHAQAHYEGRSIELALSEMYQRTGVAPQALAADAKLYLTTDQIREMARNGWSFGSHTARHPNLRLLSDEERCAEMEEALRYVEDIGGRPLLAYPFGEYDASTQRLAVSLGHRTVMQVGGMNRPLRLSAVARVPGTASSRAALFADMEIVTPILSRIKRLIDG